MPNEERIQQAKDERGRFLSIEETRKRQAQAARAHGFKIKENVDYTSEMQYQLEQAFHQCLQYHYRI